MRGSINAYFGVYKEPIYRASVALAPIARTEWRTVIGSIGERAGFITRLLLNEMPDDIEAAFDSVTLHLLPRSRREFLTSCSCPDDANPRKHIAGVTYTLAEALDRDPLVLFELRGLSRAQPRGELEASPLGRILASEQLSNSAVADASRRTDRSGKCKLSPAASSERIPRGAALLIHDYRQRADRQDPPRGGVRGGCRCNGEGGGGGFVATDNPWHGNVVMKRLP